ncbi:hypothetical protein Tco_1263257 [Tanacetum coccineum]
MSHTNLSQQQTGSSQQPSQEIQEEEDETEPVPIPTSKKPGLRGKCVKTIAKKRLTRNRLSSKFLEPRRRVAFGRMFHSNIRGSKNDALPRPPGMHMIAKSQRTSNSTASSGSNPTMFQEMMQQQLEIERKEKIKRIDRECSKDGNKTRTRWGPDPQTRIDWGIPELTGDGDGDGESPNYETGDGAGKGIT